MERTITFYKSEKFNDILQTLQVDTQILMRTERGKYMLGKVILNRYTNKNNITNSCSAVSEYAVL